MPPPAFSMPTYVLALSCLSCFQQLRLHLVLVVGCFKAFELGSRNNPFASPYDGACPCCCGLEALSNTSADGVDFPRTALARSFFLVCRSLQPPLSGAFMFSNLW